MQSKFSFQSTSQQFLRQFSVWIFCGTWPETEFRNTVTIASVYMSGQIPGPRSVDVFTANNSLLVERLCPLITVRLHWGHSTFTCTDVPPRQDVLGKIPSSQDCMCLRACHWSSIPSGLQHESSELLSRGQVQSNIFCASTGCCLGLTNSQKNFQQGPCREQCQARQFICRQSTTNLARDASRSMEQDHVRHVNLV